MFFNIEILRRHELDAFIGLLAHQNKWQFRAEFTSESPQVQLDLDSIRHNYSKRIPDIRSDISPSAEWTQD
ncbi:GSCOCG00006469001-RA-CDS [Cotesia congregata]|nr:GSCOCG00006469001-RA-CDS [Cotesia congregata]